MINSNATTFVKQIFFFLLDTNVKNSLMLIINTLFFKGLWRRKYFSPKDTKIGKFYTIDNQTIDVPFMHVFGRFYYSESSELSAKILRIPYDVRETYFLSLFFFSILSLSLSVFSFFFSFSFLF